MQDLESGLSYMLKIEVANKPIIEGPAYIALQNFIDMLGEVRHSNILSYDYHLSSVICLYLSCLDIAEPSSNQYAFANDLQS